MLARAAWSEYSIQCTFVDRSLLNFLIEGSSLHRCPSVLLIDSIMIVELDTFLFSVLSADQYFLSNDVYLLLD
jgi:hypothetical protein